MFDYYHPVYRKARVESFKRTGGWCSYCGRVKAEHAHHWRGYEPGSYKKEEETTADELVPLCKNCHKWATYIRQNPSPEIMEVFDKVKRDLIEQNKKKEDVEWEDKVLGEVIRDLKTSEENKKNCLLYLSKYGSYYPISAKNKIRFEKHKRENGTFSRTLYVLGESGGFR